MYVGTIGSLVEVLIIVPVNPLNKEQIPLVIPIDAEIKLANLKSRSPVKAIVDGQVRTVQGKTKRSVYIPLNSLGLTYEQIIVL